MPLFFTGLQPTIRIRLWQILVLFTLFFLFVLLKCHETSFLQRVALRRIANACQLHSRFVSCLEESRWGSKGKENSMFSKIKKTYRYFLSQRPFTVGSVPNMDKIVNSKEFMNKTFIPTIGQEAWGYVEYRSHWIKIYVNNMN